MMRKLLFFGVFAVLESGLVWTQNLKVHAAKVHDFKLLPLYFLSKSL